MSTGQAQIFIETLTLLKTAFHAHLQPFSVGTTQGFMNFTGQYKMSQLA